MMVSSGQGIEVKAIHDAVKAIHRISSQLNNGAFYVFPMLKGHSTSRQTEHAENAARNGSRR